MLISIYSDSTAIPRRDVLNVADTWPEILAFNLRRQYGDVIFLLNRSFGGSKFGALLESFKMDSKYYHNVRNPDIFNFESICIFTSGIVDGSPRPITYKLKILNRIPYIGTRLWNKTANFLHKFRPSIQSRFSYTPVSINQFSLELRNMAELAKNLNIFVILLETPPPHSNLEIRSPGILSSIIEFNRIKKETSRSFENIIWVGVSDFFTEEYYISADDGHHYNLAGHSAIAEVLTQVILGIKNKHN